MCVHERPLGSPGVRTTILNDRPARECRGVERLDDTYQYVAISPGCECVQCLSTAGDERSSAEALRLCADIVQVLRPVPGTCIRSGCPARSLKPDQGDPSGLTGMRRMLRHNAGERMRGIDEVCHLLRTDEVDQALSAAESPDADIANR